MTTEPNVMYIAPITLGLAPADGDLIGGTVNGVEVNGQWIGAEKHASLYREGNADVPLCKIEFFGEQAYVTIQQDSAPTTDYELHLYRYVPSGIVQIPQEYVEGLEETTANANQALKTLHKDGNPGDILVKTETGSAWQSFVEDMIEEGMLPAVKVGSDILGINNDILMM